MRLGRRGRHPQFRDLTGERFGRLVVEGEAPSVTGASRWRCRCDCGGACVVAGGWLRHEQRRFERGERKVEVCCPECSPRAVWIRARGAAQ
jgi:hypothetical protein